MVIKTIILITKQIKEKICNKTTSNADSHNNCFRLRQCNTSFHQMKTGLKKRKDTKLLACWLFMAFDGVYLERSPFTFS